MKRAFAFAIALALLGGGCSKNDSPTGPADTSTGGITRIYVNPASGSDSNSGTDGAPFKTIRRLCLLPRPANTLIFRREPMTAPADRFIPTQFQAVSSLRQSRPDWQR